MPAVVTSESERACNSIPRGAKVTEAVFRAASETFIAALSRPRLYDLQRQAAGSTFANALGFSGQTVSNFAQAAKKLFNSDQARVFVSSVSAKIDMSEDVLPDTGAVSLPAPPLPEPKEEDSSLSTVNEPLAKFADEALKPTAIPTPNSTTATPPVDSLRATLIVSHDETQAVAAPYSPVSEVKLVASYKGDHTYSSLPELQGAILASPELCASLFTAGRLRTDADYRRILERTDEMVEIVQKILSNTRFSNQDTVTAETISDQARVMANVLAGKLLKPEHLKFSTKKKAVYDVASALVGAYYMDQEDPRRGAVQYVIRNCNRGTRMGPSGAQALYLDYTKLHETLLGNNKDFAAAALVKLLTRLANAYAGPTYGGMDTRDSVLDALDDQGFLRNTPEKREKGE